MFTSVSIRPNGSMAALDSFGAVHTSIKGAKQADDKIVRTSHFVPWWSPFS
jgi:hypothetical protein